MLSGGFGRPLKSGTSTPKMEEELVVFKKKIATRFENRDVPDSFEFPRIGGDFHKKLHNKYNFVE